MAVAIANKDQRQAVDILSDAVGIALVFGVLFGAGTYPGCPPLLQAMEGASAEVLGPPLSYLPARLPPPPPLSHSHPLHPTFPFSSRLNPTPSIAH